MLINQHTKTKLTILRSMLLKFSRNPYFSCFFIECERKLFKLAQNAE